MLPQSNLLRFALILFLWIQVNDLSAYQFTSDSDTLVLETQKEKGHGLFPGFHWPIPLKNWSEQTAPSTGTPKDLTELQIAFDAVDPKLWTYENIKNDKHGNLEKFLKANYPSRIDTAQLPAMIENSVRILVGLKDEVQVLIVDENNNNDFRDDPVRRVDTLDNIDKSGYIPCSFKIYNGETLIAARSWIQVEMKDGSLNYRTAQRVKTNFRIDDQEYEIQVADGPPSLRFSYDHPMLGITSYNGKEKDSLTFSETLYKGEYLKLGEFYYQFADISNDGSQITLVKETDVSDKIGTQVGFIAPTFAGVTTEGDRVALRNYKDKYLLLVNITACWSPIMSYEYYKELYDQYLSKIEILAIDESLGALKTNIRNLYLEGTFIISKGNPTLKSSYREDYCSRTCYLIDPTGHIVDKFEISDWKKALARHFE